MLPSGRGQNLRHKVNYRKESTPFYGLENLKDQDRPVLPLPSDLLPTDISPRIMTLTVPLEDKRFLTLMNVYAPTMTYTSVERESYYHELNTQVVQRAPREDKLIILGDFNARLGTDSETYCNIIGKLERGEKNSNGHLLLNFCSQLELCITNTFFYQLDKHFFTWKHQRKGWFHLRDYIITRMSALTDTLCTKAMRGPQFSTEYYIVRSKLRLKIAFARRKAPSSAKPKKIDISKLQVPGYCEELSCRITSTLQDTPDGQE